MSKGKHKVFGYSEEYFATVASMMAKDVVTRGISLPLFESFYQRHVDELYEACQKILDDIPTSILELSDRYQKIGVKIAAIFYQTIITEDADDPYMMAVLNEILGTDEYLDMVSTVNAVVSAIKRVASERCKTPSEIASREIALSDASVLNPFEILCPFLFGEKFIRRLCSDWELVKPLYYKAFAELLQFYDLKLHPIAMRPETYGKTIKKAKVAGKRKTLADYSDIWFGRIQDIGWRNNSIQYTVSPMLLFAFISNINGLGLPYALRNSLITKSDTSALLDAIDRSIICPFDEKMNAVTNSCDGGLIGNLDDMSLDIHFCYAAILDKMSKELAAYKKAELRRAINGEAAEHESTAVKTVAAKVNALESQNRELESDKKNLMEENSKLYAQYSALKNKVASLQTKISLLQEDLQKMEGAGQASTTAIVQEELASLVEDVGAVAMEDEKSAPAAMTAEECRKQICGIEAEKRIAIVGGNTNLLKKFRQYHPQISYVANKNLGSCDQLIQNADIVLFKTDSMCHPLYHKCKQLAMAKNIPIEYIPETASITYMEDAVLKNLKKHFEED